MVPPPKTEVTSGMIVQPLVSVLVPCHNAGAWIAETLQSALAQTWQRKEVLVVDDGSTDESLAIVRPFEARGVRVISQPKQGASAARNTLIGASKGEWLQFLDADDLLAADKIEQQMRVAAMAGPGMAICARWGRFRVARDDAEFAPQPLCMDAAPVDWLVVKMGQNQMMHPGAWLVSRFLADKAGPWDTRLSLDDDGEYFTRVVLAARGVRNCPGATSYYRSQVAGSLSGQRTAQALQSAYLSGVLCAQHLLEAEDSDRTRRACADMFMRLAFSIFPDCPDIVRECETQASRHGGSPARCEGGRMFSVAERMFGWKAARRLQRMRAQIR